MKDISIFFNDLRADDSAIWIENETIKLSTSKELQNEDTKAFVTHNKVRIKSILHDNGIFSKQQFLDVLILKDNGRTNYPLSPAQERLWFIEKFFKGSNAYHVPLIFELDADVDIRSLKFAIQKIVSRHEVLRSTIEQGESREHGIQRVHHKPLSIEHVKITGKQAYKLLIKEDINRPFNLSAEYPIRVKSYTVELNNDPSGFPSTRTYILINIHHIATDGWSTEILKKELHAYYKAAVSNHKRFRLPPLQIQYKDYALWQKAYLTGTVLEKQLIFWRKKLCGYQVLEMPADFRRPKQVDYKGAYENFVIHKECSDALRTLAKRYSTTLHSVMLSSIIILLSKYTGQDDIALGIPVANRHHHQTENLIGFFVNMQVNRTRLSPSQSFEELIQQVHGEQVQAQQYQDLPFEKIVDALGVERDPSRHPLFQVTFSMHSFSSKDDQHKQRPSLKSSHTESLYKVEKFDLSIHIDDSRQELPGQVSYATALFRRHTIQRLIRHYTYLLCQLATAPGQPYSHLSLLSTQEYGQTLRKWSAIRRKYPKQNTIDQLFQKQVEKRTGSVALVYEGHSLTYGQLNEKSNQLARRIRTQYRKRTTQDLRPGCLIALYLDRGLEMIIAVLAVLKAGGAYVPIDMTYPQERIAYILNETSAEFVLSKRHLIEDRNANLSGYHIIYTDLREQFYNTEDSSNLPQYCNTTDLAYVLYTSGSTGRPKGVMVEQGSIINLVFSQNPLIQINAGSRIVQFASLIFDASAWEIFGALLRGAQLSIMPVATKQDARLVCDYLHSNEVTIALLPPALLSIMPYTRLPHLKTIVVGGDISAPEALNKWSQGRRLINAYGPTESTVISTIHIYERGDNHTNIGRPIPNSSVYVLDKYLSPVPVGIAGELYIGGDGLARGYLNDAPLTAERFLTTRFAARHKENGARLYRTGDRVRWMADGTLEFLGRNDDQVKIRGSRIELGEVEHALSGVTGIQRSCVLARERKTATGSEKYLVAYYITHNTKVVTHSAVIIGLTQVLPDYMLPSAYVELATFPFTINGKLDRQALPDPNLSSPQEAYVAPTNEKEAAACAIWQELLGLKRVGITGNFFRIGGNSILAIQVSHCMSNTLNCDVPVADIFQLKSIDKIVAAPNRPFELIRSYHTVKNKKLPNLVFVHPGHAGLEAYQQLADLLSSRYNCIGIDNYNGNCNEKIGSLNTLAHYYLSAYEKKYSISGPVNLLGWSLGGLIALEMATILERRRRKKINIFLLDTFLMNDALLPLSKQKSGRHAARHSETPENNSMTHTEKTASAVDVEKVLACSPVSSCLKHTQVTLFKAAQGATRSSKKTNTAYSAGRRLQQLPANNVDVVAPRVQVINLNCFHDNILDTNCLTISNYLLSRKSSPVLNKSNRQGGV